MKRTSVVSFGLVFAVLLVMATSGCNKPSEEFKRARDMIAEAKEAGAEDYAIEKLDSAETALNQGKSAMDGFNYVKARSDFEKSYRLAKEARDKALAAHRDWTDVKTPGDKIDTGLPTSHLVHSGECLWSIAEYADIYSDPFQWPLIYDANRDEIDGTANRRGFYANEEDWIFPGQEFAIPRNNSVEDVKNARKRAGAPAPYLPPGT